MDCGRRVSLAVRSARLLETSAALLYYRVPVRNRFSGNYLNVSMTDASRLPAKLETSAIALRAVRQVAQRFTGEDRKTDTGSEIFGNPLRKLCHRRGRKRCQREVVYVYVFFFTCNKIQRNTAGGPASVSNAGMKL